MKTVVFPSCGLRANVRAATSRQVRMPVVSAMKLYTNPGSRGKIVEWYVAEHKLDVENVTIDMRKREHKAAWFLEINPFGKVPAFEDGDVKLFESGAILLYLANKTESLGPAQFGDAAKWVLFANSTMCEAFFNERNRPTQMPQVLDTLENILSKSEYLTDMQLTKWPSIWAYMKRIAARDACPAPYQEAMTDAVARFDSVGDGMGGLLKKLGMK